MTRLSARVPSLSRWVAWRTIRSFVAVFLLTGLIGTIAECGESPSLAEMAGRSDTSPQGQTRTASTPDIRQSQKAALAAKVVSLLTARRLDEAIVTQRQVLSLVEATTGKADWRRRGEENILSELEQVSRLGQQEREIYLAAFQSMSDGYNKKALREYDGAEKILTKALQDFRSVLGESSVSIGAALDHLGTIAAVRGQFAKAKEYYLRDAAVRKAIYGEDHPAYAEALGMAGSAWVETGDFVGAEPVLREALLRHRKLFGSHSLQCAKGLARLSSAMIGLKRFPEAEAMCLQAMSIIQGAQAQEPILMMACVLTLADVNMAFDDFNSAEANIELCLALYQRKLPPGDPLLPKALDLYAVVLQKLGRADEAKSIEARARATREQSQAMKPAAQVPRDNPERSGPMPR
jgi:tetratricopeptide (TPR) repeat protein